MSRGATVLARGTTERARVRSAAVSARMRLVSSSKALVDSDRKKSSTAEIDNSGRRRYAMRSSSRRTTEGRTRTRTTWWGASGYVTSRVTVREVGLYISSACNRRNSQGHSPSNTTLHDKRATAMNSVFTSEHMVCLCCHVFV